jgi:hypothetical protein
MKISSLRTIKYGTVVANPRLIAWKLQNELLISKAIINMEACPPRMQ